MSIPKLALKKISFNKKLNTANSPNTVKTYVSTIMRVLKFTTWRKLINPSAKLIREIRQQITSDQSRNVLFSAMAKCAGKAGAVKYQKLVDETKQLIEEAYEEQVPTSDFVKSEEEEKADDAVMVFKQSPTKRTAVRALLMLLYAKRAPRRLEIADVKHTGYNPKTDNYFDRENGRFVLNAFKTVGKYGQQIVQLSPMEAELAAYLADRSGTNKLFPFGRSGLSHYMKRNFGYSCNVARQTAISEVHKNTPALKEMRDMAKQMGHSVNAQVSFYMKK